MNEEIEYNVDVHKPKRTWLWILIVIVVLAAAGAGTYMYLKSDKKSANKNKTQEEAKDKEKEEETEKEENVEEVVSLEVSEFAHKMTLNSIFEGYDNPFVLANQDVNKLSDAELIKRALHYFDKEDQVVSGDTFSIPESVVTKLVHRAFATNRTIDYSTLKEEILGSPKSMGYVDLIIKYDPATKSFVDNAGARGATYTCLGDYETFIDSSTGDQEKLEVTINVLYLKSDGCNWGEETKYQVYSDNARTKLIGEFVLDADPAKGYDEFRKYQQSVKDKAGKINFTFVKVDDEFKYQSSTITN